MMERVINELRQEMNDILSEFIGMRNNEPTWIAIRERIHRWLSELRYRDISDDIRAYMEKEFETIFNKRGTDIYY